MSKKTRRQMIRRSGEVSAADSGRDLVLDSGAGDLAETSLTLCCLHSCSGVHILTRILIPIIRINFVKNLPFKNGKYGGKSLAVNNVLKWRKIFGLVPHELELPYKFICCFFILNNHKKLVIFYLRRLGKISACNGYGFFI